MTELTPAPSEGADFDRAGPHNAVHAATATAASRGNADIDLDKKVSLSVPAPFSRRPISAHIGDTLTFPKLDVATMATTP